MGSDVDGSGNGRKASLKEGSVVRVRSEDGEMLDASIIRQHRNGEYTVKYETTGKVEKNVSKDRMQLGDRKEPIELKDQGKLKMRKQEEEDESAGGEQPILEVNAAVQFKTEKGEWCDGQIHKVRSNDRYDVVLEDDEDEVVKHVERRNIRVRDNRRSNGKTEREQIKNSDIQARFFQMPFSGVLDGVLDGLSLPSIQLPTSMFKVGSAVEVSNGAKVFLGSVVTANDLDKTFIDLKEYQQERIMKRHLAVAAGWALMVSFLTLVNYASLLNRFDFYCLLGDATSLSFDSLALSINPFAIHSTYANTVQLLISLSATTTFNLFRGVAFYLLLFAFPTSGTNFIRRVVFLLPSIAVTALMCAVGGAALHTFYYVQKTEMLADQVLTLSTDTDLAVMLLILSLWFIYCVYSLTAATGRFSETRLERQRTSRDEVAEDVLSLAERGEFGLQAQREALVIKVEQRQEQLGVCKLNILRVYRYVVVHFVASAVAIYIDVTLLNVIKEQDGSSVALHALGFHLGISIAWLIGSALAVMLAISVRQQSPELLAYILDV
ncbi:hypothetical protein BBO99_00007594 [Phytophthora kernoviae]|uniref:Tudor domain-containing protein n=2 Tax=Phytophthora kernoviae TaxID=325452 RepID=A0A3R7K1J6_9STRA|nr:hypothetical protein G195_008503 [Phytophthora kernoviae 00238/432]KAG2511567.1 hypothetical protein JM16_008247 [Phytophthora kernoviae]KAG2515111.1 hypothetical protein JM18_008223 [Phytophthora kernoviae]RLN45238.1 hypothetical protein BBI17_008453 [Phytophthora kernoviae]RLN76387.1 hypothetical protein BBO99_00007594 [Phytophthora kernoviae]